MESFLDKVDKFSRTLKKSLHSSIYLDIEELVNLSAQGYTVVSGAFVGPVTPSHVIVEISVPMPHILYPRASLTYPLSPHALFQLFLISQ